MLRGYEDFRSACFILCCSRLCSSWFFCSGVNSAIISCRILKRSPINLASRAADSVRTVSLVLRRMSLPGSPVAVACRLARNLRCRDWVVRDSSHGFASLGCRFCQVHMSRRRLFLDRVGRGICQTVLSRSWLAALIRGLGDAGVASVDRDCG